MNLRQIISSIEPFKLDKNVLNNIKDKLKESSEYQEVAPTNSTPRDDLVFDSLLNYSAKSNLLRKYRKTTLEQIKNKLDKNLQNPDSAWLVYSGKLALDLLKDSLLKAFPGESVESLATDQIETFLAQNLSEAKMFCDTHFEEHAKLLQRFTKNPLVNMDLTFVTEYSDDTRLRMADHVLAAAIYQTVLKDIMNIHADDNACEMENLSFCSIIGKSLALQNKYE